MRGYHTQKTKKLSKDPKTISALGRITTAKVYCMKEEIKNNTMITFYCINQPESTWMKENRCEGTADTSLTKRGKAQATQIARWLLKKQIDGIITSRLNRAAQCAKIIHQFIPQKIKRDERINDMNLGIWQGKFPEEIEARFPQVYKIWKTNPTKAKILQAESMQDVYNRVYACISDYQKNTLFDTNFVVCTHDIIIRLIITIATKKSIDTIWEISLTPGSVTTITLYPDLQLIEANNTKYVNENESE